MPAGSLLVHSIGTSQHRLEQHLAPASASSGWMLSASLWLQAVLARGEDHRGRHVARDIDRVVAGAGDDLARDVAELRRALAHQIDARGIERLGRDAGTAASVPASRRSRAR